MDVSPLARVLERALEGTRPWMLLLAFAVATCAYLFDGEQLRKPTWLSAALIFSVVLLVLMAAAGAWRKGAEIKTGWEAQRAAMAEFEHATRDLPEKVWVLLAVAFVENNNPTQDVNNDWAGELQVLRERNIAYVTRKMDFSGYHVIIRPEYWPFICQAIRTVMAAQQEEEPPSDTTT